MSALPAVVNAEYRGEYRIRLVFKDGRDATVNFAQWLDGPIFEALKDKAHFARFFIDCGTISRPNGADIAPETLHRKAKAAKAA